MTIYLVVALGFLANILAAALLLRREPKPVPAKELPPAEPSPQEIEKVTKTAAESASKMKEAHAEKVESLVEELKRAPVADNLDDILAYAKDTGEQVRDEPKPGTTIH